MKLTNKQIKEVIMIEIKSLNKVAEFHEKIEAFDTAKRYYDKANTIKCLLNFIEALEEE